LRTELFYCLGNLFIIEQRSVKSLSEGDFTLIEPERKSERNILSLWLSCGLFSKSISKMIIMRNAQVSVMPV
jgi:hypothetical protein